MKLNKILFTLIFSIFLIHTVSAIVVYGEWQDQSQSITINEGDGIYVISDFGTLNPPMTINVKLYDSNSDLIYTFENNLNVNDYSYSQTYTVDQSVYQTTGSFELILSGSDNAGDSQSQTLYLTVNAVTPVNNDPVLNAIGNRQINEGQLLRFTITTTDPDGDILTLTASNLPDDSSFTDNGNATGVFTWQTDFSDAGTYSNIVFTVSDGVLEDSEEITITVNNVNNPPVITSTPVTDVNETSAYSYQVIATDADADVLSYSLTQNPTWLSIDSATGLITGTAPSVTSDTNYAVDVQVLDGTDTDTQSYVITVMDVPTGQDITPPTINISYPVDGVTYTTEITTMIFEVFDPEGNLNSCWYSIDNDQTNQTMDCVQRFVDITSVNGLNTWTVYADDTYGNKNSVSVTFTVDPSVPDTTPPTITILSPENREYDTDEIFFEVMTDETAVVVMSLDNAQNITMNDGSGLLFSYTLTVSEGSHEVVFYATDGSGNTASASITFSVDLPSTSKSKDKKSNFINFFSEDEEKYLSQFESTSPVIDLTDGVSEVAESSVLGKIWNSIIDFFRRLFGFR